jgi:hypothetical protein
MEVGIVLMFGSWRFRLDHGQPRAQAFLELLMPKIVNVGEVVRG